MADVEIGLTASGLSDFRGCVAQGMALFNSGDWANAKPYFEAVYRADKEQYDLSRTYAKVLGMVGDLPRCAEVLEYCAAKEPHNALGAWMLGNAYNELGRSKEGQIHYERALMLAPRTPLYEWAMSLNRLVRRDYLNGFALFGAAYNCKQRMARSMQPEWEGQRASKPADTLYICGEMGFGDNILFARFVRRAKEIWGGAVVLEMHDVLIPLLHPGNAFYMDTGADMVIQQNENMEMRVPHAHWVNLGSLPDVLFGPHFFEGWEGGSPLSLGQYAAANTSAPFNGLLETNGYKWTAQPKAPGEKLRVGIAWQGNSRNPMDRTRSMRLEWFLPLMDIEGAEFYNLQLGGEWPKCVPITPLDVAGVDKLAAAITQMDLVVTVDTLPANLAATLGVKTLVLSSLQSDYRWSGETPTTSDFYPSAIVCRQKEWMKWDAPVQQAADIIKSEVKRKQAHADKLHKRRARNK